MPLIIPGLILVLAGPWFPDQEIVGWILIGAAAVITAAQIGLFAWITTRF